MDRVFHQPISLPDPGTGHKPETIRAAALAITARARGKDDAVLLLTACGLIEDNGDVK